MVPNIDGTEGNKIKTRNPPRHGTQCVIDNLTYKNASKSLLQNRIIVFGPHLFNSLRDEISDRHEKC